MSGLSANEEGQDVVLHGYVDAVRVMSKNLVFVDLLEKDLGTSVQVICAGNLPSTGPEVRNLATQTPVAIRGIVQARRDKPAQGTSTSVCKVDSVEIKLSELLVLNQFPTDIKFSPISTFGPEQRHLQLRHGSHLRHALAFRSELAARCRNYLQEKQKFVEIETPLLFKSTPEGAREFLVPTRVPGQAYALPQSPQQYKQMLMASGIPRYFQIARCFRDEDLRADRQPEFTQLDLEMSFAQGKDVMDCIEGLVRHLWSTMLNVDLGSQPFTRMSYHDAMSRYGSDKPDTRLGMEITRIGHLLPVDLISKIGPLNDPIVEAMKFSPSSDPAATRAFVSDFMSSPAAAPFFANPAGQPGIFIYDPRKPLAGLSPFGFEAAEFLEEHLDLSEGDMLIIQARPDEPFAGGSTPLGNLRLALHQAGVAANMVPKPTAWSLLWITDFPLFTPLSPADAAAGQGQGGATGLASTHHPFTAPASPADVDKLASAPLDAKAEHYDLVLNGVEVGGGSRRIHHAAMQELVLRRVLGIPPEHVERCFGHLLAVLRAGCPPHAGLALGFDRLVATMLGRDSIRDVIAFPKDGRGRDAMVGSPTAWSAEQAEVYHLRLADEQGKQTER